MYWESAPDLIVKDKGLIRMNSVAYFPQIRMNHLPSYKHV